MIDETKIMQYADGTLPEEEKETVKKAIENDPQLQKLLKDYQETGEILFAISDVSLIFLVRIASPNFLKLSNTIRFLGKNLS